MESTSENNSNPQAQQAASASNVDTSAIVSAAEAEYIEHGKLSDATYAKIAEARGLQRDEVDAIIEGRKAKAEAEVAAIRTDVLSVIGGDEKTYETIASWAKGNMPAEELAMFDKALHERNVPFLKQQLKYMKLAYDTSVKAQQKPSLFNPSSFSANASAGAPADSMRFRNHYDMRTAMRDPRYNSDPNYTKDVVARVQRGFIE